jgi:uncharacterized membrane protein
MYTKSRGNPANKTGETSMIISKTERKYAIVGLSVFLLLVLSLVSFSTFLKVLNGILFILTLYVIWKTIRWWQNARKEFSERGQGFD